MRDVGTVLAQVEKQPPNPTHLPQGLLQPETQRGPDWKVNAVKGSGHRADGARPAVRRPVPQAPRVQRQVTEYG